VLAFSFLHPTESYAAQWTTHYGSFPTHVELDGGGYCSPWEYPQEVFDRYGHGEKDSLLRSWSNHPPRLVQPCHTSRSVNGIELKGSLLSMHDSFPPNVGAFEPQTPHDTVGLVEQHDDDAFMDFGTASTLDVLAVQHQVCPLDVTRACPPDGEPAMRSRDEDFVGKKPSSYAQFIFCAIMDSLNKAMTVHDIYRWFEKNSDMP
jgi:hypothetical protein